MNVGLSERISTQIDRAASAPLTRQVYAAIRQLILSGDLKAELKLPSSRELAADLSLGRNTVIRAYEQLTAEGYLTSQQGAGSFVAPSPSLTDPFMQARARLPEATPRPAVGTARLRQQTLSQRARAVLNEPDIPTGGAFGLCAPDLSHFPIVVWQRLLSRAWRRASTNALGYADCGGLSELRQEIADYLCLARQVRCTAEQVVVVNGAQQGLDLCARLLADAGDRAWVEDPGFPGARRVFRAADLQLVPIAVSTGGMSPSVEDWATPPRLIYITPSHQFPTGVIMGLAQRRELLCQAARHGSWIIEDDYDGEFRFSGKPIASLQGIDEQQRVIYVGTFSKALFPALRLAYIVVPEALAAAFALAASRLTLEGRRVTQSALAAFLREGHFTSHIRRMRMVYAGRQALLAEIWQRELGDAAPLSGLAAGMHVVTELPRGQDVRVSRAALDQGILAQSLKELYIGSPRSSGLVLGYGAVHEREIRRQGTVLARLVASFC
jgi:GntR family transcriptional regulator/MocR family aminotransferase